MIEQLRSKMTDGRVEYSLHAVRQVVARNITPAEVVQTFMAGEVIEDYPKDKYGPSCLVAGLTKSGRMLHIHCTHPTRPSLKIITAYEPQPEQWDETLKRTKA